MSILHSMLRIRQLFAVPILTFLTLCDVYEHLAMLGVVDIPTRIFIIATEVPGFRYMGVILFVSWVIRYFTV